MNYEYQKIPSIQPLLAKCQKNTEHQHAHQWTLLEMLFKYAQRERATDSRLDLADHRSTKRYVS
jgi:hypothetical protein